MSGKYDKVELIGSGAFGNAWLVLKTDTGRKYVLKEVQVLGMSEKAKQQALTEVRALARCKHINIVRYREAYVEHRNLCIVMEFADGGDLNQTIQAQKLVPFDNTTIIDWFIQICFALRSIHSLSIIHRDLKTQNIFLTSAGIIKLGDLGIARILKMNEDHANTAIGTPYYLSPEICKRKPYDYKTDMWAAGCVLYELCTFKRPFEGPCFSSLVMKITQGRYKPIPASFGPILEDLISVLLKKDPGQRPTAEQVLCIPSLQPYIEQYVQRTQAIREQMASPCVVGGEKIKTPQPAPLADRSDQDSVIEDENTSVADNSKRSLSTHRQCNEPENKRRVQSAQTGAGCTPRKLKQDILTKSPRFSMYKDVLRKRKPLAQLTNDNSPQPLPQFTKANSPQPIVFIRPESPIANRTRRKSQEIYQGEADQTTPDSVYHSPRNPVQRSQSERPVSRVRVQELIRKQEQLHTPSPVAKEANVNIQSQSQEEIIPDSAIPAPPKKLNIKPSDNARNPMSPMADEPSLERQVQYCLLQTCCPKAGEIHSHMETLRHFLETKLGQKQFHSVYNRLKEFGTQHVHLDSFCSNVTISTCFPALVQLLQLEHFAGVS